MTYNVLMETLNPTHSLCVKIQFQSDNMSRVGSNYMLCGLLQSASNNLRCSMQPWCRLTLQPLLYCVWSHTDISVSQQSAWIFFRQLDKLSFTDFDTDSWQLTRGERCIAGQYFVSMPRLQQNAEGHWTWYHFVAWLWFLITNCSN